MVTHPSFVASLLAAAAIGSAGIAAAQSNTTPTATNAATTEITALREEVERLKSIAPGQSLAMTQVAYNFNNLWFAAHAENWPLAQFYLGDARGRLRWALRITPVRKIATGDLTLAPFLDNLEKGQLAALGEAVAAKNMAQFESTYRAALEGCYACHVASEKPYLRLDVPTAPAEPMVHFAAH